MKSLVNRAKSLLILGAMTSTGAIYLTATPSYAANLIHHYQFTNNITDSVGNAHGELFNGASTSNGKLILDGIDDYVEFDEKIVPTSQSYSIALFAQQNVIQNHFVELISQGYSGGPAFYFGHSFNRKIRITDAGQSGIFFPSDGLLHHYAVTVDADAEVTQLYVDGNLLATLSDAAISTSTGGTNTRLGRQFDNPGNEFFNGIIDDVRIYEGTLTASEVDSLASSSPSTSVPEPSTALALGILGLLFGVNKMRRCRHKS
ncbi:MAG: LamG domain-containing protein [Cyanobacteria bacterium P01_E01_bin.42]